MGLKTDAEILEVFGEDTRIRNTLEKEQELFSKDLGNHTPYEFAMLEIYRKLRPGEPPTVDSCESLMQSLLFDARRYDLSAVGRYKFNKKLDIARRLMNHTLAAPITDPWTGELLADVGETISRDRARELADRGVNEAVLDVEGTIVKIFANNMVEMAPYVDFDPQTCGVTERVRLSVLQELLVTLSINHINGLIKHHTH